MYPGEGGRRDSRIHARRKVVFSTLPAGWVAPVALPVLNLRDASSDEPGGLFLVCKQPLHLDKQERLIRVACCRSRPCEVKAVHAGCMRQDPARNSPSVCQFECRLCMRSRAFGLRKPIVACLLRSNEWGHAPHHLRLQGDDLPTWSDGHRIARQRPSFRSLIHFTIAGSRWEKKLLLPASSVATACMSCSDSSKSKTARFSSIRSFRTDFARATTPR